MATSVCPYHDKRWRGETQHLINCLRGKLLPARQTKAFRRVVCSCEDKQIQVPPKGKDELSHWLSTVSDGVVPQEAKKVLREMLSTSDPTLINVVALIRQASIGDLHYFDSSFKASTSVEPVDLEEKMKLDFPAAYLGLLMGCSGKHIKALCKQHNVEVHFTGQDEGQQKGKEKHVTGPAIWAVVKHRPGTTVEDFKMELKKKAEKIAARRKLHEASVITYMKIRAEQRRVSRQKYAQAGTRTTISVGVHNTPKEAAVGHFEKKTKKSTKSGIPTVPYLTDGHCLQCGAPFNRTSNAGCTYHSGYLVISESSDKHKWSCCHKETEEAHPDLKMHETTGCCSGLHIWRPTKGVRRKHKVSPGYVTLDMNYVLH